MADDYSLYGNPEAISRQRAMAQAMMNGALNPVMPQRQGNMASVASPLSALAAGLQGYMSAKISKKADADEKAMRSAYKTAMDDYANKGFAAMQGTPEQRIPAEVGVRPTNNPIPALTGEQSQPVSGVLQSSAGAPKPADYAGQLLGGLQPTITKPEQVIPGRAPDMAQAAQYFAKNPNTAAIAQKLMEKQAETIAQQNAPYDPAKFADKMTGQALAAAMPAGGLTNANVGAFLQKGFAGGGMPKPDGDRVIDQGTGQITNLPMTANQKATTDYNKSQTSYNWAKLSADQKQNAVENYLKAQGLNNQQVQIQLDRMKLDPEYQAQVASAVDMAKAKSQKTFENSQHATTSLAGLDLLSDIKKTIPQGSDSGLGRLARAGAAFAWGGGGDARVADAKIDTLSNQIAMMAQRFPGVQTDKDYDRMMAQVGVLTGMNRTQAEKMAAADQAQKYMATLIGKYGTPEEKMQAAKYLKPASSIPDDIGNLVNQYAPGGR